MKMKKQILILLISLSLVITVSAQNNTVRKVDNINSFICDDLKARVYNFATEIINVKYAKGYIIVYEGKFDNNLPRKGEANSRIELIKKHFKFLRYSTENIVFVNAGFRENLIAEFWLVPKNAEPPKPSPTLEKIKHRKGKAPKLQMGDC